MREDGNGGLAGESVANMARCGFGGIFKTFGFDSDRIRIDGDGAAAAAAMAAAWDDCDI